MRIRSNLLHQSYSQSIYGDADKVRCHPAAQPAPVVRSGPHFCLGAALARLELRCAFPVLLVRLEDLALTIAAQDVVYSRLTSFAARSACRSPSALPSLRE